MGVKGLDDILREQAAVMERLIGAAGAGLYAAGNRVMTTAKAGLVPVDQGVLRGSGYVTHPVREGDSAVVELGFGGPAADYAVVQHEEQGYAHEVGTFKYLEKATQQEADAVPRIVAEHGAAALARRATVMPRGENPQTPWQASERAAAQASDRRLKSTQRAKAKAKAARMGKVGGNVRRRATANEAFTGRSPVFKVPKP